MACTSGPHDGRTGCRSTVPARIRIVSRGLASSFRIYAALFGVPERLGPLVLVGGTGPAMGCAGMGHVRGTGLWDRRIGTVDLAAPLDRGWDHLGVGPCIPLPRLCAATHSNSREIPDGLHRSFPRGSYFGARRHWAPQGVPYQLCPTLLKAVQTLIVVCADSILLTYQISRVEQYAIASAKFRLEPYLFPHRHRPPERVLDQPVTFQ